MKRLCCLLIGLTVSSAAVAADESACRSEGAQTARDEDLAVKEREAYQELFGEGPRRKFAELNKRLQGRLSPLFSLMPKAALAYSFVTSAETRPAYSELLVTAFQDHRNAQHHPEDIADTLLLNFLLTLAPPEVVVSAIAPEVEAGGRLEGILGDRRYEDLVSRMQNQELQGYIGPPDFRYYAMYLHDHRKARRPEALLRHMYRLAPAKALYALMHVEYGIPYPPPRLTKNPEVNRAVRPLFYAEHIISDVIWHWEHGFEVEPERVKKASGLLSTLVARSEWWVRLYAAEIVRQHPRFRSLELIRKLRNDKDHLVREVASAITSDDAASQ